MKLKGLNGWAVTLALCSPVWLAALAAAAEDKYSTPAKEPAKPWAAILYVAVFLVASLVVAFKHARRTHLD